MEQLRKLGLSGGEWPKRPLCEGRMEDVREHEAIPE